MQSIIIIIIIITANNIFNGQENFPIQWKYCVSCTQVDKQ